MRYLVNSDEMKMADSVTIQQYGVPSLVLMERAALSVVEELYNRECCLDRVLVVCGTGNNGGDGAAIARLLQQRGASVDVVLLGERGKCSPETSTQFEILNSYGIYEGSRISSSEYTTIVDAVFGIGLSRAVTGIHAEAIEIMNAAGGFVVAVDIPSGICTDTGRILGTAVRADLTVTFAAEKLGTVLYPGAGYAGEVVVKEIGITDVSFRQLPPHTFTYDRNDCSRIPERPAYSNKGSFGKVLIIGGTAGMAGAAYMCAKAAYYTGAGLVKIITPEENRSILQTMLPEALLHCYDRQNPDLSLFRAEVEWADIVVIGPGCGRGAEIQAFLTVILTAFDGPAVFDADALNLISIDPEQLCQGSGKWIVTPHLGEMARLTGKEIALLQQELIASAQSFSESYDVTCVMKDARTVVVSPEEKHIYLNTSGNSGMAKGGSGDVLSGMIAGLLALKMPPAEAARLGVYLHGEAGDQAAARFGKHTMTATDIINCIGKAMKRT